MAERTKRCPYCAEEILAEAIKCKHCGEMLGKAPESSRQQDASREDTSKLMECPNCKSAPSIKTIKMLCLAQTTTGSGTAIGIDSNLDVGVATISTQSKTNLASRLLPGPKPTLGNPGCMPIIIGAFLVFCFFAYSAKDVDPELAFAGPLSLILAIGAFIWGALMYARAKEKHPAVFKAWEEKSALFEKGWVCAKCGHTWIPGASQTPDVRGQEKQEVLKKRATCPECKRSEEILDADPYNLDQFKAFSAELQSTPLGTPTQVLQCKNCKTRFRYD